jgi:hypothetical protein
MRPDASRGFFFFGLRFTLSLEWQPCCRFSSVVVGLATRFGSDPSVGIPLSVFLRELCALVSVISVLSLRLFFCC